jgi:5-methylcytosine-specific restriction endonuclease McrA
MGKILDYLNEQEPILGIKEVREDCRKYLLKKTYAGCEKIKRKSIPRKWIDEVYVKQDGICPRCNEYMQRKDAVGDHQQPLALGGQHNRWNIQAMHSKCNASKGANDFVKESKLAQTGQTRVPIENEI